VLMGFGMWWPSVLAPGRAGYFGLTFLALALCAMGTLWVLAALPEASPWFWAASPALLVYSGLNWDLFGILPLALGLWLWAKGRERAAVAVLSLAVWTKFFPLLVLGVLLLGKPVRRAVELLGIFAAISLLLNLPFAIAATENWLWVLALIALASVPAWLATAVSAVAFADFVVSFSFLHLQSDRVWPQVTWFARVIFWPMVSLRYLALFTCAGWAFSHALRRERVE